MSKGARWMLVGAMFIIAVGFAVMGRIVGSALEDGSTFFYVVSAISAAVGLVIVFLPSPSAADLAPVTPTTPWWRSEDPNSLGNISLSRLTPVGWLLAASGLALGIGLAILSANLIGDLKRPNAFLVVAFAIVVGYFYVGTWLLGMLGIPISRKPPPTGTPENE